MLNEDNSGNMLHWIARCDLNTFVSSNWNQTHRIHQNLLWVDKFLHDRQQLKQSTSYALLTPV